MNKDKHIELHRTFHQLINNPNSTDGDESYGDSIADVFGTGDTTTWDKLTQKYRVVLLAEAGAGKTQELRQAVIKLRSENKISFFIRLENITDNFEISFEEGSFEEFKNWLDSNEEGWILLDSVDEARLKSPKDFETAVRKISHELSGALGRTHIIITSRINAWRTKEDLGICNSLFSFETTIPEDNEHDVGGDNGEKAGQKNGENEKIEFTAFSLNNLSQEQIKVFIQAKGVVDTAKFTDDIERHDAWKYTTRPQDLEDLVEYWKRKKKVGTHFELMEYNVERRLIEADQNRSELENMSADVLLDGVMRVAAAVTLTHESAIGVLDGTHQQGLRIKEILPKWTNSEYQILLTRPIFDVEIYGAVRFHHRSVREYLTAKWMHKLLEEGGDRRSIENLIFRQKYNVTIVPPTMKSILSWLILFDEKIRNKAYKIDPGIIFECGDPGKLPKQLRCDALRDICKNMSTFRYDAAASYESVQRFSNKDITDEIKNLLTEYKDDKEVIFFLIRMIWLGQLSGLLEEAKNYALDDDTEHYTKIAAIKGVRDLGDSNDCLNILNSVSSDENESIDRGILSEIVQGLTPLEKTLETLFLALKKTNNKKQYKNDNLNQSLSKFTDGLSSDLMFKYLKKSIPLLKTEPFVANLQCEISTKYYWLVTSCLDVIERLVLTRDKNALSNESLTILSNAHILKYYHDCDFDEIYKKFTDTITAWKELNCALFWKSVEVSRKSMSVGNDNRLSRFRQVSIYDGFWKFDESHFDLIKTDIINKDFVDDKLVALSLAFQIYRNNERPRKWREDLKRIVGDQNIDELQATLNNFLNPPAASDQEKQWKKQVRKWKRSAAARKEQEKRNLQTSIKRLSENINVLIDKEKLKKGEVTDGQLFLLKKMTENNRSQSWLNLDWRNLESTFGADVVSSFRDGLVYFWRFHKPTPRSEKDLDDTSIPGETILGLVGLEIESKEVDGWLDKLTEEDVDIACSYAFYELNGFPNWFSQLYCKFPSLVKSRILKEVAWELDKSEKLKELHHIISNISEHCGWLWDDIASDFLELLNRGVENNKLLEYLLKIVQGSSTISDKAIADIACTNINDVKYDRQPAIWYAVWVGVQPDLAINKLSKKLASIADGEDASEFSMLVVTHLVEGHHHRRLTCRDAFKKPKYLKNLHLLMHKYIRVEDDLDRSKEGSFSPVLRDDAQDARDRLISILRDIPGKESYVVLKELAENHPAEHLKSWIKKSARKKAEEEADLIPWSSEQFEEFHTAQEKTPSTHHDLYGLAVRRLFDLKHDLEDGDNSSSSLLINEKSETKIRNFIGGWCRDKSMGRYSISQEEELSDEKRPDIRFVSSGFDAPVPIELKLANNWSGPDLFERLENQLCGDYLRDNRSNCGIYLLVYLDKKTSWKIPNGNQKANFRELIEALKNRWGEISKSFTNVEHVEIIAFDLTKRKKSSKERNF